MTVKFRVCCWQQIWIFSESYDLCLWMKTILYANCICNAQELEEKRKERSQVTYERKKQLNKLRIKAEKVAEEKLGPQLDIIAPVKY